MFAALKRRHWLLQVVLATLLAAAVVPTLSRALSQWRGTATPWAEVCTTAVASEARAGMAMAGADGSDAALAHLLEHCPLCSLHTDMPAILPAATLAMPLPLQVSGVPAPASLALHPTRAWAPAQARAPPLGS